MKDNPTSLELNVPTNTSDAKSNEIHPFIPVLESTIKEAQAKNWDTIHLLMELSQAFDLFMKYSVSSRVLKDPTNKFDAKKCSETDSSIPAPLLKLLINEAQANNSDVINLLMKLTHEINNDRELPQIMGALLAIAETNNKEVQKFLWNIITNQNNKLIRTMALCYEQGISVKEDQRQALRHYQMAADHGDLLSMRHVMDFYLRGRESVPKNPGNAFYWARILATRHDPFGMYIVGKFYAEGAIFQDNHEANRFYGSVIQFSLKKTSLVNYAINVLSQSFQSEHLNNNSTNLDRKMLIALLERIKKLSNRHKRFKAKNQHIIDNLCRNLRLWAKLSRDIDLVAEAASYESNHDNQRNNGSEIITFSTLTSCDGNEPKVLEIDQPTEDFQQTPKSAIIDEQKVSETDQPIQNSQQVPKSETLAPPTFQESLKKAKSGNVAAARAVADDYRNGRDVEKDLGESFFWFYLSAEKGSIHGSFETAKIFQEGITLPVEPKKACDWLLQAYYRAKQTYKYILANKAKEHFLKMGGDEKLLHLAKFKMHQQHHFKFRTCETSTTVQLSPAPKEINKTHFIYPPTPRAEDQMKMHSVSKRSREENITDDQQVKTLQST